MDITKSFKVWRNEVSRDYLNKTSDILTKIYGEQIMKKYFIGCTKHLFLKMFEDTIAKYNSNRKKFHLNKSSDILELYPLRKLGKGSIGIYFIRILENPNEIQLECYYKLSFFMKITFVLLLFLTLIDLFKNPKGLWYIGLGFFCIVIAIYSMIEMNKCSNLVMETLNNINTKSKFKENKTRKKRIYWF